MSRRKAKRRSGVVISRAQARPTGIIEQRSQLLARKEILEKHKRLLHEVQSFEKRIDTLDDVLGWNAVRKTRRAMLKQIVQPQERAFAYILLHQKAIAYEIQLRGRRAKSRGPMHQAVHWTLLGLPLAIMLGLIWVQETSYRLVTRGQRMVLGGVVVFPSSVQEGLHATKTELSDAEGRHGLWRAVFDERDLTPARRSAILFLSAIGLVLMWVLAEIFIRMVDDSLLEYKHATDVVLGYSAAAKLFLPLPHEPVVHQYAGLLGWPMAILASSVGACLGSWLLYLAGSEANKEMERRITRRAWGRKFWPWFKRNSHRYGYILMGIILSIPWGPDAITAVFALLRLSMRWFLVVVFASSVVRMVLYWYFFA